MQTELNKVVTALQEFYARETFLFEKDLGIAVDLAEETGVAAPLLGQAGELFARARAGLGEDADYLEMIRLVERESGVEIRA